jgi:hypothetical protein
MHTISWLADDIRLDVERPLHRSTERIFSVISVISVNSGWFRVCGPGTEYL